MIRHLLATTAVVAVMMGGAAWAQDATTPAEDPTILPVPEEGATVEGIEDPAAAGTEAAEGADPILEPEADTVQESVEPMLEPEADTAQESVEPMAPAEDGTLTADPAADPSLAPVLVPVDIAEVTVEELVGANVRNTGGESLGSVDDALLSDAGEIESLVVSFGGFLGFGQRTVQVGIDEVSFMRDEGGAIIVETIMTPESLEALPDYVAEPAG